MVVSINSTTGPTRVCVIDAEEASRTFRHFAPLHSVSYLEICRVDMPRDEAWRTLRDAQYTYLQSTEDAVFIVMHELTDEKAALMAEVVAATVFGLDEPQSVFIRPSSSQAGLAAATSR